MKQENSNSKPINKKNKKKIPLIDIISKKPKITKQDLKKIVELSKFEDNE